MDFTDAMIMAHAYESIGIRIKSQMEDMLAEGYTPEESMMMLGLC